MLRVASFLLSVNLITALSVEKLGDAGLNRAACRCPFGIPVRPSECSGNFEVECASCSRYYHLEDQACVANKCACENGYAVPFYLCPNDGENRCGWCKFGYYLNVFTSSCDKIGSNHCSCENGTAVEDSDCTQNGANQCAACNGNYHLEGDSCVENVCYCNNGEAVPTNQCVKDGAQVCASCDDFYYQIGNECEQNVCTCENGQPETDACASNGSEQCVTCNTGFHLFENQCVKNNCYCTNGNVADVCRTDNTDSCQSCTIPGYHLRRNNQGGFSCGVNYCVCANGQPVGPAYCYVDNANICSFCSYGYHLEGHNCVQDS